MKKKWPFILAVSILLIGILGSILVLHTPNTNMVEIVQDGRVLYQLDLSQVENQTIEVEYDGRVNTIQIQNGRIRMLEADCPDHTCIQMGCLNSLAPIVCLPNHLVIQYADHVTDTDVLVQ